MKANDVINGLILSLTKRLGLSLVLAILVLDCIAVFIAVHSLEQSRRYSINQIVRRTQDLARRIDHRITDRTDQINLTLLSAVDKLDRQLRIKHHLNRREINAFLHIHAGRLKDGIGLWVANTQGRVILGSGDTPTAANWRRREFFQTLRTDRHAGLQVSTPMVTGETAGGMIAFARRFDNPDGSFAGAVAAEVPLAYFDRLLAAPKLGLHDMILLRGAHRVPIVRSPPASHPAAQVRSLRLAGPLQEAIASGRPMVTLHIPGTKDAPERVATYRRLSAVPFRLFVTMTSSDHLQAWHRQARHTGLALGLFILVTLLATWFLWRCLVLLARETERRKLLLHHGSDGIHILDEQGRVIEINDQFCTMLGYTCEEMIGMHPSQWDVALDPERLNGMLANLVQNDSLLNTPLQMETRHRRKDGYIFDVEITAVPVDIQRQRMVFVSSRNITDRKLLEATQQENARRLQRLTDFNALLAQINSALSVTRDEAELLQSICDLAIRYAHFEMALIARPGPSGWFQYEAMAGATGFLKGQRTSIDPEHPEGRGSFAKVWREKHPVFIDDSMANPTLLLWRDQYRKFGFKSNAVLPILRNGRIWGIFALFHSQINAFDGDLRDLLRELSLDISRGLDKVAEHNLQQALLTNSLVGILLVKDRIIEKSNLRAAQMLGRSVQELEGQPTRILYADEQEWARAGEAYPDFQNQREVKISSVRMAQKDGSLLIGDFSGVQVDAEEGFFVWTIEDVTERHAIEQTIRELSAARATLLGNTTAGIDLIRYPERIVEEVNQGFLDILGMERPEEIIGRTTDAIYPSGEENRRMLGLAREVLAQGHASLRDLAVVRRDGRIVYVDVSGQRLAGGDPEHPVIVWTSVDVTERHRLTEELARQALIDSLTELPNRRALRQELVKATARSKRHDRLLAVLMMDLDNFKQVNDTYGHEAGDRVLQLIGNRLQGTLRRTDFVARMGGDEFILLIEDFSDLEEVGAVLDKLEGAVCQPIPLENGNTVSITLSGGLCLYPLIASDDPDVLLHHADLALYENKAHKRDRQRFWTLYGEETPRLRTQAQKLLHGGGLRVFYQPVLANPERSIIGVEALARLQDEDGLLFSPAHFLPQLETDDLFTLSLQVLDQALHDMGALDKKGISLWFSVNLDPRNISAACVGRLQERIAAATIDPGRIYLEILEGDNFAEQQQALEHLHSLKAQGVRLALDDVGSAYSSLLRLKELPIDKVKLDQSFVRTLEERPQDLQFVESILDLANGLGRELVVEGVETEDILDAMSVLGVPAMQGYGIARPMPFVQLRDFLHRAPARPATHPTSLMGIYAKVLSNHGSRKKSILQKLYRVEAPTLAEHTACPIHADLLRLGIPEGDLVHRQHAAYHRVIATYLERLLASPTDRGWDVLEAAQNALLESITDRYRKDKEDTAPGGVPSPPPPGD